MADSWISGNGDRSGGSYSSRAADYAISSAGVLLPGQRIGTVSQVVYRDKTVQTASGEFCQEPGHDAEDKVQSSDPGVLHAASGISCDAECVRKGVHHLSDHLQVRVFLYKDTHGPCRRERPAGGGRIRR